MPLPNRRDDCKNSCLNREPKTNLPKHSMRPLPSKMSVRLVQALMEVSTPSLTWLSRPRSTTLILSLQDSGLLTLIRTNRAIASILVSIKGTVLQPPLLIQSTKGKLPWYGELNRPKAKANPTKILNLSRGMGPIACPTIICMAARDNQS